MDIARIQSAWLEWNAEPTEGQFETKLVEVLVNSLDAHADDYLEGVEQESTISEYVGLLRRIGSIQIQNVARGILSDPYSEDGLRRTAQSSGFYIRRKHVLAPQELEAELREEVERLRLAAIPEALKFQEHKNGILFRIETRFESRYQHWTAQAIERVQSRTLERPPAPNNMPAFTEKEEGLNPGGLPTETWARIQAVHANYVARMNNNANAVQAVCEALQTTYDTLIEADLERGGTLNEHVLRVVQPNKTMSLGVELDWLRREDMSNPEVERAYQQWLWILLEGRAEYWRAYCNAQPFNIKLPKPGFVVRPLPASPNKGGDAMAVGHPRRRMPESVGVAVNLDKRITELPQQFQDAFEGAKAQAELNFSKRAEIAPQNPYYARNPIHRLSLIEGVFFAYCDAARNACRAGIWPVAKARQASESALAVICNQYFVREHGELADDLAKSNFGAAFMLIVEDGDRWKQHLSELIELSGTQPTLKGAEAAQTAPGIVLNADKMDGRGPIRGHGPATAQSSAQAGTPGAGRQPEPEQDTASDPPQQTTTELRLNSGMAKENPPHEPAARFRRYGFEAKMDLHVAIAETIGRYDARWKEGSTGWCNDSNLVRICADLDKGEIQIPAPWKKGTTGSLNGLPLKDWTDALDLGYKKLITDQLRYSLKMAAARCRATTTE